MQLQLSTADGHELFPRWRVCEVGYVWGRRPHLGHRLHLTVVFVTLLLITNMFLIIALIPLIVRRGACSPLYCGDTFCSLLQLILEPFCILSLDGFSRVVIKNPYCVGYFVSLLGYIEVMGGLYFSRKSWCAELFSRPAAVVFANKIYSTVGSNFSTTV